MTDRNAKGISIEMLPLPEPLPRVLVHVLHEGDMELEAVGNYYAAEQVRACVAHATAAKDAEIESLRAEVNAWVRQAQKEADRAKRLAEALRELRDLMLGQVKWMPCDCGCPQQRTPDGPHSVTWLRAAQQVEIAIGKSKGGDRE